MSKTVLYINGLGDGATQAYEANALKKMKASGLNVTHAHVHWRKEHDFPKLLTRLVIQARNLLKSDSELIIVGLSAGSSMALNLYAELNNTNIRVVNIIGRLKRGHVLPWSYRTMERAAHLGTKHESQTFYDSVIHCEDKVLPSLTVKDKQNIVMLKPLTDLIVPLHTMSVTGINDIRVPALGHVMACSAGSGKAADLMKE